MTNIGILPNLLSLKIFLSQCRVNSSETSAEKKAARLSLLIVHFVRD